MIREVTNPPTRGFQRNSLITPHKRSITGSLNTNITNEKSKPKHPFFQKINIILESSTYQIVMSVLTLIILFADDIKILTTPPKYDPAFSAFYILLMIFFLIEVVLSSIAVDDYFLSFFFWLDIISLSSTLLDIHWLYTFMIHKISGGQKKAKSFTSIVKAGKSAKVAARAVRILRVVRIIRLVRVSKLYKAREKFVIVSEKKMKELIKKTHALNITHSSDSSDSSEENNGNRSPSRVINQHNIRHNIQNNIQNNIQIFRNNNQSQGLQDNNQENPSSVRNNQSVASGGMSMVSIATSNEINDEIPKELKIGKKLSQLITQRVILIILILIVGIILFNSTFYYETFSTMSYGMMLFQNFDSLNNHDLNHTFNLYVQEHAKARNFLVFLRVGYLTYGEEEDVEKIRETSKGFYSGNCIHMLPTDLDNAVCYAYFDNSYSSKVAAMLNIMKTFFVGVVLALGSYCFNIDITELVLDPLEEMTEKVNQIAKNPVTAMILSEKEEIEEMIVEEEQEKQKKKAACNCCKKEQKPKEKEESLETKILQGAISKIGMLLALSFGEAGGEIVSKNMQKASNGEINPFLPGKQIYAVFFFIRINDFFKITDIIQNNVIILVNEIADIVHEVSSEYCGTVVRNFGDSFLVVWKFPLEYVCKDIKESRRRSIQRGSLTENFVTPNKLFLDDVPQVHQITDLALICYIKIIQRMVKSKKLDEYREDERLKRNIPDFDVTLNAAIDLGWAIEGPIGSPLKVDATYLSPYYTRVEKLDRMCDEYGVNIILTDSFVEQLTEKARNNLRMIDITKLDISTEISSDLGLFTIDLDCSALPAEKNFSISELLGMKKNKETYKKISKFRKRVSRKKNFKICTENPVKTWVWEIFEENDEDFGIMKDGCKEYQEFLPLYNEGFDEFHFGNWETAKQLLEEALEFRENDGPTEHMLDYMDQYDYNKPDFFGK